MKAPAPSPPPLCSAAVSQWPMLSSAVIYMVLSLAVTILNKVILSTAPSSSVGVGATLAQSSPAIASPRTIILLQCLATTLVLGVARVWRRARQEKKEEERGWLSLPSALLPMVVAPRSKVSLALKVEILVVVICFSIYAIAGLQSLGKLPLPLYVAHRHGSVLVVYLLEKLVLREGKKATTATTTAEEEAASSSSTLHSTIAWQKDAIVRGIGEDIYVLAAIALIISGGSVTAVCDFYHTAVGCHAVDKIGGQELGTEEQVDRIPIKVYAWVATTVVSASLYVTLLRKLAATHSLSSSTLLYDTSALVSIALCAESFARGELSHLVQMRVSALDSVLLMCTCILGTLMNIAVYHNTARNGPLTQTICGIFKNTISMLAGLVWFNGLSSIMREKWKVAGLAINYIGSLVYAWAMYERATRQQALKQKSKEE